MRRQQIDILRGLAVLLVLGRHLPPAPPDTPWPAAAVLDTWLRCGWVGVDLFFVLSGFLVSGLLFSEFQRSQELRIGRFLFRRGLKIYPAFYVMIAASFLFFGPSSAPVPWKRLLAEIFFFQNYVDGLWNHTWSLAIEEHFYLLLSGLMFVLVRRKKHDPFAAIPGIFLVVGVAALSARIYLAMTQPYNHQTHLFPTHLRLDSLLFGVLLSYLHSFHRAKLESWFRPHAHLWTLLGVLLVAPSLFLTLETSRYIQTIGLTQFYVGFGLILLSSVLAEDSGQSTSPSRLGRPIAFVGVYSYSIYLWHMPVLRGVIPWLLKRYGGLGWSFQTWALIYVVLAVGVGAVLGAIIERPFLMIRDRLVPSSNQRVEAPAPAPAPELVEGATS